MLVFSAEPGSASHDGLQLLANWAAANNVESTANDKATTDDTPGNQYCRPDIKAPGRAEITGLGTGDRVTAY
jgi:hypothetical protein